MSGGRDEHDVLIDYTVRLLAAEREACAKIADDEIALIEEKAVGTDWIGGSAQAHNAVVRELRIVASRIRARGTK